MFKKTSFFASSMDLNILIAIYLKTYHGSKNIVDFIIDKLFHENNTLNLSEYPTLQSLRQVFKIHLRLAKKFKIENKVLSLLNDPRELNFFLATNFDFQTKALKSGWLTISNNLWVNKSNTNDNDLPILGMSAPKRHLRRFLVTMMLVTLLSKMTD